MSSFANTGFQKGILYYLYTIIGFLHYIKKTQTYIYNDIQTFMQSLVRARHLPGTLYALLTHSTFITIL